MEAKVTSDYEVCVVDLKYQVIDAVVVVDPQRRLIEEVVVDPQVPTDR